MILALQLLLLILIVLLLLLLLQLLLLLLLLGQRERDRRPDVIGDLRARARVDDEPHRDQRRRWVPRRV